MVCGNFIRRHRQLLLNILFGCVAVIGQVGQNVSMPLWLASGTVKVCKNYTNSTETEDDFITGELLEEQGTNCTERSIDSYFVYTFACMGFVLLFGLILLIQKIIWPDSVGRKEIEAPQLPLVLVGVFDALNGVMVVFASNPSRTAPYLQSILGNFMIPLTVIFRLIILRKRPTLIKGICAASVFIALLICMLPDVIPSLGASTGNQASGANAVLWPMIFMLGFTPAAVMNVVEEKVLKHVTSRDGTYVQIDMVFFFFCTSMYQLLTAGILFWVDFLPWYGTAGSIQEMGDNWRFGFLCFFGGEGCSSDTGGRGTSFILFYMLSYLGGGLLIRYAEGATLLAVVSALVTPLGFIFWTLFQAKPEFRFHPEVNHKTEFAIGALVLMIPAIFLYNVGRGEVDEDRQLLLDSSQENPQQPKDLSVNIY